MRRHFRMTRSLEMCCHGGGMVDTRDLKSLAHCGRVGSSPTRGTISGSSSVGRAQPCQGWGREFESRFPLNSSETPDLWIGRCYFKSLKDNGLIFWAFSAYLSNSSQSVQNRVQGWRQPHAASPPNSPFYISASNNQFLCPDMVRCAQGISKKLEHCLCKYLCFNLL